MRVLVSFLACLRSLSGKAFEAVSVVLPLLIYVDSAEQPVAVPYVSYSISSEDIARKLVGKPYGSRSDRAG